MTTTQPFPERKTRKHTTTTMNSNNNNDTNDETNENNDNQDNDDDSPVQPRRNLLLDAFNSLRTPLRNRSRNERQQSIDRQHQQQNILTLEADLGLVTTLFSEEDIEDIQERNDEEKEEQEKDKEKEEQEKEKDKENIMSTSTTTTYKIGGVEIEFDTATPTQNTDYNVGVMMSKEDRPDSGTDTERKLIESLCKNQYTKYKKAETSMKSVERLLQSRSIMDTIEATETILNRFDMKDPFTIVYPEDETLDRVALKMKPNGGGIRSLEILSDFRQVTVEEVALSCAWWNLHGHYKNKNNEKQSYGRDMNWSYLHFKNHVDEVLYNDTDKIFHSHSKKERGGPLFFKLLTDAVLSANEDSLVALESTIKNYNIATDGKNDVPEAIKVLQAGSKLITAMRDDGSNKPTLPDKFVVNLIKVLCTTSVEVFNKKMEAYQGSLELALLVDSTKKINTPTILNKVFTVARNFHKELFDDGIWETEVLSKAKSTFSSFWRNRCWNCEKENCNLRKCKQHKDQDKIERNKTKWLTDVQANPRDDRKNEAKAGGTKKAYPEWRPPEPSENNKRVIYGDPHTWDGRKSWIKDGTPGSGLPDIPLSANNTTGTGATAAVPGQVTDNSDDATQMTSETGLTQEDKNELRRFEASIKNMGANLSGMGAFISNLSEK